MGHTTREQSKHYQPPSHRMLRTLDHILEVMTADLIVNLGVFGTSVVLMAADLGWFHTPDQTQPQRVVIVRKVTEPAATPPAPRPHN